MLFCCFFVCLFGFPLWVGGGLLRRMTVEEYYYWSHWNREDSFPKKALVVEGEVCSANTVDKEQRGFNAQSRWQLAGSPLSLPLAIDSFFFLPSGWVVPAESLSDHCFFCHLPGFLGAVISYHAFFLPRTASTHRSSSASLFLLLSCPLWQSFCLSFSAFVNRFSLGQVINTLGKRLIIVFLSLLTLIAHLPLILYVIFGSSR